MDSESGREAGSCYAGAVALQGVNSLGTLSLSQPGLLDSAQDSKVHLASSSPGLSSRGSHPLSIAARRRRQGRKLKKRLTPREEEAARGRSLW